MLNKLLNVPRAVIVSKLRSIVLPSIFKVAFLLQLQSPSYRVYCQDLTQEAMPQKISRVAVIGTGPSGLSAVKALSDENAFETIRVFERRDRVGGIW